MSIVINLSRAEFGNAVSSGLLIPYILRRAGATVSVIAPFDFPREWTDMWFDQYRTEYSLGEEQGGEGIGIKMRVDRLLIRNRRYLEVDPIHVASIPVPDIARPMLDPYVVLIPTVYGHLNQTVHWRTFHALKLEYWLEIAAVIRKHGLKVVCFGADNSCTQDQLKSIGDRAFFCTHRSIHPKNEFFPNELAWLKHAVTSVALGGAFHILMSFDVPGIGWDGQVNSDKGPLASILAIRRSDLHYLPHGPTFAASIGAGNYSTDLDHFSHAHFQWLQLLLWKLEAVLKSWSQSNV